MYPWAPLDQVAVASVLANEMSFSGNEDSSVSSSGGASRKPELLLNETATKKH